MIFSYLLGNFVSGDRVARNSFAKGFPDLGKILKRSIAYVLRFLQSQRQNYQ